MAWTVLTGDIVDSTGMTRTSLDALLMAIESVAMDVQRWEQGRVGFAVRGGDGWQMVLPRETYALRAALLIQARLHRIDRDSNTRIALATGPGELPDTGDANRGHGPAFTASGRLLSDLPRAVWMSHADGGATAATLALASHLTQSWTVAQASAMAEALLPEDRPRTVIAERLNITRQAVDQALNAAGFRAIEAALTHWETADRKPDRFQSKKAS